MHLKQELNLIVGLSAAITLGALGVAGGLVLQTYFRKEIVENKGRGMARALAPACARALEHDETAEAEIESLVAELKRGRDEVRGSELDLESFAVIDDVRRDDGGRERVIRCLGDEDHEVDPRQEEIVRQARASSGDPKVGPDRWGARGQAVVDFAIPLRSGNTKRGVLWFSLSLERARWLFWRYLLGSLGITALGAIAVWFTLYKVLKRRILVPILELSRGIERVRSGDLTARVALERKDEFGGLVSSFNELVQMLRDKPAIDEKLDEAERVSAERRRLAAAHSALAEAHSELKSTQERLVLTEKQASLGRLVKSVAHELKNPLNMAQNALPSLESSLARLRQEFGRLGEARHERSRPDSSEQEFGRLGEARHERSRPSSREGDDARAKAVDEDLADVDASLELLRRAITRAVSIIHDLQGFSQLGLADLAAVDLRRIVDDAGLSCADALGPQGRVQLEVDVAGENGNPIVLKAFPTLLVQVFVNLFTNAAHAIQGPGKIWVVARVHGDRVRVEVKDSGPGIPPENLPKLFEPFFTTKGTSGTGLGLALCYAYLEKHGGTIEAKSEPGKSEPGKGATFTIDIPLEAKPAATLGPRASSIFDGPTDSVAEVARGRRGG